MIQGRARPPAAEKHVMCHGMTNRSVLAAGIAVVSQLPMEAYACSGPGAVETIARNTRIGMIAFLLALSCFVAAMWIRRRRNRRLFPFLLWGVALLLVQFFVPSPLFGDCGILFRTANIVAAVPYVILLGVQLRDRTKSAA